MGELERYMATVRVGPKGQIVIPHQVRAMFKICPGDLLMLLADVQRGIAIHPADTLYQIVDGALGNSENPTHAQQLNPAAQEPSESDQNERN